MKYSIFDIRKISNKEIRDYFEEVVSCYENENYRSAILVLYTVVLYDLFFKLRELKDEYSDSVAGQILDDIFNEMRSSDIKSSWEDKLVESLYKQTEFEILDDNVYSTLQSIKQKRNLSAHPSFSGDEIYQPSRELVLAFIKEVYDNLLIRPSMLIKKQVDIILTFLDEHKGEFNDYNFYLKNNQNNTFLDYFKNKYYTKLSKSFKTKLINTLWRFTFEKIGDIYEQNRHINIFILGYIYSEDKELFNEIVQSKVDDKTIYNIISQDTSKSFNYFAIFLSENPEIYSLLTEEHKKVLEENFSLFRGKYFVYERFRFGNLKEFLNYLIDSIQIDDLDKTENYQIEYLAKLCINSGEKKKFSHFCITKLEEVPSWSGFDDADLVMKKLIIPNHHLFDEQDFNKYKEIVESNNQISARSKHALQHEQIKKFALDQGIRI
uniref:Uncharacterized protein n=1 Tax=Streptococcus suis TaxID=1307 RepID=M1VE67_STRSU|nr:hypothetical protein [Streptococcus suis]